MSQNTTFHLKKVKISNVAIHPLLEEAGYDNIPDEIFLQNFKHFNWYDKPVATYEDGQFKILTHAVDYNAIKDSNGEEIELYVTNLSDDFELRRFIGFRHQYHNKNLIKSYNTIKFLKSHLNSEKGMELSNSISGDINAKIASLMGTSKSTVKRIANAGDYNEDYLGLLNEGNISFKAIEEEKKNKKLKEESTAVTQTNPKLDAIEDEENENGVYETGKFNPRPEVPAESKDQETSGTLTAMAFVPKQKVQDSLEGLSIQIKNGLPVICINGIEISNIKLATESLELGDATSRFLFREQSADGIEISISIKNYNAAKNRFSIAA